MVTHFILLNHAKSFHLNWAEFYSQLQQRNTKKHLHCVFTSFRWIVNMVMYLSPFVDGKHITCEQRANDASLFSVYNTQYTLHVFTYKMGKVSARAAASFHLINKWEKSGMNNFYVCNLYVWCIVRCVSAYKWITTHIFLLGKIHAKRCLIEFHMPIIQLN